MLRPLSFKLDIRPLGRWTYELTASQVLTLPREKVFVFFEDPRNLFEITPDWLRFEMKDRAQMTGMYEGAAFDYTIRWFGMQVPWRSGIREYRPPERFRDIQLAGPYRSWSHLHLFAETDGGTRMSDRVTYQLPLGPLGALVHAAVVRRQLDAIFRYRALRVDEWTRGRLVPKPVRLDPAGQPR